MLDAFVLSGGAQMKRLLIVLVVGALGYAMPGAAVAQSERGTGITELIYLFFSDLARGILPKRAVAETRKDAGPDQDAGKSQEERRREALARVEEQEREARKARAEYRLESHNALAERQNAGDGLERDAGKALEERLRVAELRMLETEREAHMAKEEYQRAARKAREDRLLDGEAAGLSD